MFLNLLNSLYLASVRAGTWLPTVSGHNMPTYIQHYISCNKVHQATPTFISPTAALIRQRAKLVECKKASATTIQHPIFKRSSVEDLGFSISV